jgi:radical SAM superfamily enzyme YgiQ (UPF0313 family)
MKKKKVVLVGVYLEGIYPRGDNSVEANLLAPAFLKTSADADSEISNRWDITVLNLPYYLGEKEITSRIFAENPDLLGYSVYIWNYTLIQMSVKRIHEINPHLPIIWGGPQVSYNSMETMERNPQVCIIVCGNGETRFKLLLKSDLVPDTLSHIPGITYRDKCGTIKHVDGVIHEDLSQIPSPYQSKAIDLDDGRRHCAYVETFRGCLFKCGYCVGGNNGEKGLNLFPIDQILKDIEIIYNHPNVAEVVFTDSCLFYTRARAKLIIEKILSSKRRIPSVFTLDISFLDEASIDLLNRVQLSHQGLLLGMQSTNAFSLQLMNRRRGENIYTKKVELLRKINPSVKISFDLIYGLAGDNFETFKETVEFALRLRPTKLNFSPLLLLPGSPYWNRREEYGFVFDDNPPHVVYSNKYYSFEDMEKTFRVVLSVAAVMYFPAIMSAVTKLFEMKQEYTQIELIQKLTEIVERKMGFNIDSYTENTGKDFLKNHYIIKKNFMDRIAMPLNCLYFYEATLELLQCFNAEDLSEDIILGINYYKTVSPGHCEEAQDDMLKEYGPEKLKYLKIDWVVSE